MAVILDTGIAYAYYDRSDKWHSRAVELIHAHGGALVLPAPVIPEVDHLLGVRLGSRAQSLFYEGLSGASYFVADLPRDQYARVAELNERFADLELGFVDAAVVAIAEAIRLRHIATTDRKDFEPLAEVLRLELLP